MKCKTCDGCGKLDSGEMKPWTRYLSDADFYQKIFTGAVEPVNCPDCKASGQVDSAETKPQTD